ncbi:hypothetical protein ACWCPX_33105 [Streptomyces olivaceoviridis]
MAMDGSGNVFIADYEQHRVRKITTSGTITTVAGNGQSGNSGEGGPAVNADRVRRWVGRRDGTVRISRLAWRTIAHTVASSRAWRPL